MERFKKLSSMVLAIAFAMGIMVLPVQGATEAITIEILHVNDTHSRVFTTEENLGYAGISSYYDMVKKENPSTYLVDAGDTLHGDTFAHLEEGSPVVKLMNEVGYDVMVPGNHDFNYGFDRLMALSKEMNFPLLAANITGAPSDLAPFTVIEKESVKVAFIGVTTPESAYKTHPDNVKDIEFSDVTTAVEAAVADIEALEVDLVVVIAHLGLDGSTLVAERSTALKDVQGIDLIIDAHSHSELATGQVINENTGLMVVSTGDYGRNIGRVTITIEKDVKDIKATLVPAATALEQAPANEKILASIQAIAESQSAILDEVVGKTDVVLVGDREVVRKGESNLGNLIAESVLTETGADIVIYNGGNVRATLEAGELTKNDILTVLPFSNYSVSKEMPGSAVKEIIEHGVSAYPETSGGFPQIAGMRFEFDSSREVGDRVVSITVDGKEIEEEALYTVVTNDFLAAGGDDFITYTHYPIKNEFGSPEDAVIAYLQSGAPIPVADGRIKNQAVEVAVEPAPVEPVPTEVAPAELEVVEPAVVEPVAPETPEVLEPIFTVYVVKSGDVLWKIARDQMGNSNLWKDLHTANPEIKNPNFIYVGQEIKIPA